MHIIKLQGETFFFFHKKHLGSFAFMLLMHDFSHYVKLPYWSIVY